MKKSITILIIIILTSSLLYGNISYAACNNSPKMQSIVSCDWLDSKLDSKNLTIIDIRTSDEYVEGHIKGSINIPFEVPFSDWITMKDDLLLELPETNELLSTIGKYGISKSSKVVIVSSTGIPRFPEAGANRVAFTLVYAGIKNVSILDGGYPMWISKGKEASLDIPSINPVLYKSGVKSKMLVDIDYVKSKLGKSVIIDGRDYEVYAGEVTEPWTEGKLGHIPGAVSLPAQLVWNEDSTYKSSLELYNILMEKVGPVNMQEEIIVYCGVGGYGSSLWYVLTQILNYKNVKLYDGSSQEWAKYYDMEF